MSRSAAGTYTLPLPPVNPGDLVDANWANPTLADIAQALTDSLDRYGRGGMLAPFKFLDGDVLVPSISFTNEPNTGFYRESAGVVGLSLQGVQRMRVSSLGVYAPEFFATVTTPSSDTSLVNKGYVTTQLALKQNAATAWNTSNFDPNTKQNAATAWNSSNFNPGSKQDVATAWNTSNFNPGGYAALNSVPLFNYVTVSINTSRMQSGFFNTTLNLDVGKAPAVARGLVATSGAGTASVSFPYTIPNPRISVVAEINGVLIHTQVLSSSSSGFTVGTYVWNSTAWVAAAANVHWIAFPEAVSI